MVPGRTLVTSNIQFAILQIKHTAVLYQCFQAFRMREIYFLAGNLPGTTYRLEALLR